MELMTINYRYMNKHHQSLNSERLATGIKNKMYQSVLCKRYRWRVKVGLHSVLDTFHMIYNDYNDIIFQSSESWVLNITIFLCHRSPLSGMRLTNEEKRGTAEGACYLLTINKGKKLSRTNQEFLVFEGKSHTCIYNDSIIELKFS